MTEPRPGNRGGVFVFGRDFVWPSARSLGVSIRFFIPLFMFGYLLKHDLFTTKDVLFAALYTSFYAGAVYEDIWIRTTHKIACFLWGTILAVSSYYVITKWFLTGYDWSIRYVAVIVLSIIVVVPSMLLLRLLIRLDLEKP